MFWSSIFSYIPWNYWNKSIFMQSAGGSANHPAHCSKGEDKSKNQCLQILIKCTFLYSKPRWTLKIRSYSMTLFLITFFRTPWGHFSKNTWKFWKLGKKNFLQVSTSEKMENIKIFKVFFCKKIILFLPWYGLCTFPAFFWGIQLIFAQNFLIFIFLLYKWPTLFLDLYL